MLPKENRSPKKGLEGSQMAEEELVKTVGYCGLVCGVCRKACQPDCRNGGGYEDCYQRKCCIKNGFDGCWQCENFPCDRGLFADEVWKGLCIGSVMCIKDKGTANYVDLLVSKLGKVVEYGDYRYKDPQEIRTLLCGDSDI